MPLAQGIPPLRTLARWFEKHIHKPVKSLFRQSTRSLHPVPVEKIGKVERSENMGRFGIGVGSMKTMSSEMLMCKGN
jgi:hypothetical protein